MHGDIINPRDWSGGSGLVLRLRNISLPVFLSLDGGIWDADSGSDPCPIKTMMATYI